MKRLEHFLIPMILAEVLILSGCDPAPGTPAYNAMLRHPRGSQFTGGSTLAPTVATNGFHKMQGFGPFGPIPLQTCIPVYQGEPPKDYPYKNLGPVKGAYTKQFMEGSHASRNKALENIADNAKAMNANAVIKIQPHMGFSGNTSVDGEAVVFDVMPKE